MPDSPMYRSQVLDHLGLVAGMFDALGIGDVLDHATHQNPEMRDLTVGEAIKAMLRNGLGCINQALSLVPGSSRTRRLPGGFRLGLSPHSCTMMPSVGPWIPSRRLG
jgi:hypothetical protein